MNINLKLALTALFFCQLPLYAAPLTSTVANDPVFTQTTYIGKVFHDRNGNGYQDTNEEGIPGVRLVSVTGLLLETDGYGRFHLQQDNLQGQGDRQNIVIKLDQSSLPMGAVVTTENPRVVRSVDAMMNKLNFGIHFRVLRKRI